MLKLIDFYSERCPPCRVLAPILDEVTGGFEGQLEFEKVNVDQYPDRAAEVGVMSIPTLVLMKKGQEVDRKVGLLSKEEMIGWLEDHLGE